MSPTAIVHLYYLYLIEKNLGLPVSDIASITEIGGGYGGLCRTVHSLGFEGDYTIVDLPGMLAIQDHYLGHTLPQTAPDVSLTTTDKYSPKDRAGSILIATFSLNEMPLATRKIVESWMPHFDYLFFAHNNVFDGIDNVAYFEELADRLSSSFAITKRHEPRWCHVVFAKNKR